MRTTELASDSYPGTSVSRSMSDAVDVISSGRGGGSGTGLGSGEARFTGEGDGERWINMEMRGPEVCCVCFC